MDKKTKGYEDSQNKKCTKKSPKKIKATQMDLFIKEQKELNASLVRRIGVMDVKNDQEFVKMYKIFQKMDHNISKALEKFTDKVESLDETILSIYHNIKRNQFLYAYHPEEVIATFEEIKRKIIEENAELKKVCNL